GCHLPARGKCPSYRIRWGTKIDGDFEAPQHRGKPLTQVIGNAVKQERFGTQRASALLAHPKQGPVKYLGT
ncbi:MAG: hypothetical protein WCF37_17620, partial [Pseudolabrys sp.]